MIRAESEWSTNRNQTRRYDTANFSQSSWSEEGLLASFSRAHPHSYLSIVEYQQTSVACAFLLSSLQQRQGRKGRFQACRLVIDSLFIFIEGLLHVVSLSLAIRSLLDSAGYSERKAVQ